MDDRTIMPYSALGSTIIEMNSDLDSIRLAFYKCESPALTFGITVSRKNRLLPDAKYEVIRSEIVTEPMTLLLALCTYTGMAAISLEKIDRLYFLEKEVLEQKEKIVKQEAVIEYLEGKL